MADIDYKAECHIYLRLKANGEKVTQAAYCELRSQELGKTVSLFYFKKVLASFKAKKKPLNKGKSGKTAAATPEVTQNETRSAGRLDWGRLKADFMAGTDPSVSAFLRNHGIKQGSTVRKNTKGWKEERKKIESAVESKTVAKLIDSRVAEKIQDCYAEALSVLLQVFAAIKETADNRRNWPKINNPYAAREVVRWGADVRKALADLLPDIKGLQKLTEINQVFADLSEGKIEITQACYTLMQMGVRLPKMIESIMVRRQSAAEEPPIPEGEIITDEQILARRAELLLEIEDQRTSFVAERTEYVAELKKQMQPHDSFAAQADETEDDG